MAGERNQKLFTAYKVSVTQDEKVLEICTNVVPAVNNTIRCAETFVQRVAVMLSVLTPRQRGTRKLRARGRGDG